MNRVLLATLAATAASATFTIPALAHQTVRSNGARVTLHVDPNDEPEAGKRTTIRVLRVAVPRNASFSFRRCRCRIRITNAAGAVMHESAMRTRLTFTFPRAGAYRLDYSGRYTRSGRRKRFSASFAIRAF